MSRKNTGIRMKDNMKKILLLLSGVFSYSVFSQDITVYPDKGDELITENTFRDAESTFSKGLTGNPENPVLKSQPALSLISQDKNDEAEKGIDEIPEVQPEFTAAPRYSGISNFSKREPGFRKAVDYFEKVYALIDVISGPYSGVNYFIGRSYKKLLYREGLTAHEMGRMLEADKKYIELQPGAEDHSDAAGFVKKAEEIRPGKNVGKWIMAAQQNVKEPVNTITQ